MRIIQLLPTLSRGDAIGNEAIAIRDMLRSAGRETGIYAEHVDPALPEGTALDPERLPALATEDILLYHLSTGTRLNKLLPTLGGRKLIRYHNITPPEFFRPYSPRAYKLGQKGYEGMRFLADKADRVIAASDYNRRQLRENGYICPIDVCPILIPFSEYDQAPDPAIPARFPSRSQGSEWTNLLFVGRITPNKKQEDAIKAFCAYHRRYNPKSRLILAGNAAGMRRYDERLKAYAVALFPPDARFSGDQPSGIRDADPPVIFTGRVTFPELLAWYRVSDAFLCMSEHEGFCVPLTEAMHFGKPIVAFRAAAVPETAGRGALLLDTKDPETAAEAIHRVLTDADIREALRQEQRKQLERYSYENTRKTLLDLILNS